MTNQVYLGQNAYLHPSKYALVSEKSHVVYWEGYNIEEAIEKFKTEE